MNKPPGSQCENCSGDAATECNSLFEAIKNGVDGQITRVVRADILDEITGRLSAEEYMEELCEIGAERLALIGCANATRGVVANFIYWNTAFLIETAYLEDADKVDL